MPQQEKEKMIIKRIAKKLKSLTNTPYRRYANIDRGLNLENKDYTGMEFSGNDVSNRSFRDSILRDTRWIDSHCADTDFSEANMRCANMTGANCSNARFNRTDTRGIKFKNTNLADATFYQP